MYLDGLEDAYEPGRLMGGFAEETAQEYQFTREAQDAFAIAVARARAEGAAIGRVRPRDRPRRGEGRARASPTVVVRRAARQGRPRQDPDPEARFLARTARSPRPTLRRSRRRRRVGDDARERRRAAWASIRLRGSSRHAAHAHAPSRFTTAPVVRDAKRRWRRPAGRSAMLTCSKSTRRSPASR